MLGKGGSPDGIETIGTELLEDVLIVVSHCD